MKNINNIVKRDIIEWDILNWGHLLTFWDNISKLKFKESSTLEIGARNGGISLWLALKGLNVLCTDLNGPAEKARLLHKKYNVSHLVKYESVDATNIPYEDYFDIITFKSVLGGIGRGNNIEVQQKAIKEMYKALKPGGKLLFAENLIASPFHQFLRKRFIQWGQDWRYITIEEMLSFLKSFSTVNYITVGFFGAFGRNEFQRKILGWIDKCIFNKITPDKWKYIIIGIAQK
jgi:SAM-dependent methyltransferase